MDNHKVTPRILFVEDNYDYISMYQTKFEMEGISFDVAKTGREAQDIIKKQKPDLILLDLLLIQENGLEILATLKQNAQTQEIPVIVFTNYPKAEYKTQAINLGAVDFISKADVTPTQFITKIKEILFTIKKNGHP